MLAALLALAPLAPPLSWNGPIHGSGDGSGEPAAVPLLARVAVVGSSASNGFGLTREVGRPVGLGDVLGEALLAPHEIVSDATNSMFFMSPDNVGEQLLSEALEAEPTLVVAIDYLFWFAYGHVKEEQRPELFERGLALLDTVPCTLLVGDLPDMSSAVGGGMLLEAQVPEAGTLAALNVRLEAWAAERERVHVVPVARFVRERAQGGELRFGNLVVGEQEAADLLQLDRLHPNLRGTAALALLAMQTLVAAREDVPGACVRWSLAEIAARVLPAREPEAPEESPEPGAQRERAGTLR